MAERKSITATQVLEMIKRQNYACAVTGRKLTPETASIDHIVPLSRGGGHSLENIWVVDHQVNVAKGTLTVEEFIQLCRDVIAYQDAKPTRTPETG